MPGKSMSEKDQKRLQAAHVEYRNETGAKIIHASKLKDYFKKLDMRSEKGLEEEVADLVYKALWKAALRCNGNNRMTVKDIDV